jgi:hypothetical protein
MGALLFALAANTPLLTLDWWDVASEGGEPFPYDIRAGYLASPSTYAVGADYARVAAGRGGRRSGRDPWRAVTRMPGAPDPEDPGEASEEHLRMAREGGFPPGFDGWRRRGRYGTPLAHIAAEHGTLPADFKRWAMRDREGVPAALAAARAGKLPRGFA